MKSTDKILIFVGTTEGRTLFEALTRAGADVDVSVATAVSYTHLDVYKRQAYGNLHC